MRHRRSAIDKFKTPSAQAGATPCRVAGYSRIVRIAKYLINASAVSVRRNVLGVYPDDGTNAETLLKNADTALIQAKACGRSNHQFFQPDMNVRARKRAC
jgi:predicted signal transduction protein with EAL and GGDEF domain